MYSLDLFLVHQSLACEDSDLNLLCLVELGMEAQATFPRSPV